GLVVAEFALALTLLATGGLALRGFWNLTRIDLGIQTDNVLTFQLPVPAQRLDGPDQIRSYYGRMLENIQAIPGVTKAAVTTGIPGLGSQFGTRFTIVGQPVNPAGPYRTAIQMVTPDYVDTLGIRMVSGRTINEYDTANGVRVATVNEHFVKQYMAGVDPLAQRISFQFRPAAPGNTPLEWQIVGVYHNLRGSGNTEDFPEINIPFAQAPFRQAAMVIRTSHDPKTLVNSLAG